MPKTPNRNNFYPPDSDSGWKVGLVVHDGVWASTVYSALDLFQSVNLRHMSQLFSCNIISAADTPVHSYSGQLFPSDQSINDDIQYDLIMLPHYWGSFEQAAQQHPQIANWLKAQHQAGAVIAATNGGIFWAAEAGLLDGRRATSYWRNLQEFAQRYPNVEWLANQSLVEDSEIYSSNGQNASMDLAIHLVGKFCGADMAAGLVRDITFDSRRNYNLTLFNISGLRQHRDNGVHKAQDWLDKHYHQQVEFQLLAEKIGMSKRTFIRRFQKATADKPTRYLQRLRVEAAKHQLLNSDDSIKSISLSVGYRDYGYFSQVFKSITELSPRQFRLRYRPTR